jgi:predicted O-methyltransferase YrrM
MILNIAMKRAAAVGGWLLKEEMKTLWRAAATTAVIGDIVEIGSYKGKSTIMLAAGLRQADQEGTYLYAVDPHILDSSEAELEENIKAARLLSVTKLMNTTSSEARPKYKGDGLKALFIDGLHTEEACQQDYDLWHDLVKPGGALLFHDSKSAVKHPGPCAVVKRVMKSDKFYCVGRIGSLTIFIRY